MEFKANEIKTGTFIIATLIILGIFLVSIFGVDFGKKTKEFRIYLQYVGGIAEGSLVKFRGMNVGQVTEIKLPEENEIQISIKLEVDESTPVRTDSKVFLTAIGLMADQHIEITAGSLQADMLPPGSIIESKEALSFAEITETLGEFNEKMQGLINQVSEVFNEKNRTHLASTIENFDSLIEEGREPFLKTVSNLNVLSAQLENISVNMAQLVDNNRGRYQEILSNLEVTTRATKQITTDLKNTTKNLEILMSRNNINMGEIIENFQTTSLNLEEFTRTLKEQPWTLVRKAAPPERDIP